MELQYVSIRGSKYPACFSLRTAMRTAEKFGKIDAIFEEHSFAEATEINAWLLAECLKAGKIYAELEGETCKEPPELENLYDMISIKDAGRAVALIMEASQKVTVDVQPKNAKATQGT